MALRPGKNYRSKRKSNNRQLTDVLYGQDDTFKYFLYIAPMTSYPSFIKSRIKQIGLVSLILALMGTISFYTSSEININPLVFIVLWFFVLFALTSVFLLIVHSVLYFLFRRR